MASTALWELVCLFLYNKCWKRSKTGLWSRIWCNFPPYIRKSTCFLKNKLIWVLSFDNLSEACRSNFFLFIGKKYCRTLLCISTGTRSNYLHEWPWTEVDVALHAFCQLSYPLQNASQQFSRHQLKVFWAPLEDIPTWTLRSRDLTIANLYHTCQRWANNSVFE